MKHYHDRPQTWEELGPVFKKHLKDQRYRAPQPAPTLTIDPDIFAAIFKIHDQVVATGDLHYLEVAQLLWQHLFAEHAEASPAQKDFTHDMLVALRRMDMHRCMYPDIDEMIDDFFVTYTPLFRELLLWSTGDVGIQIAKMLRTRLPRRWNKIATTHPACKAKPPRWFISTKKHEALARYLEQLVQETKDDIKLVVIEDARNSLAKVEELTAQYNRVEFIPIFARYSQEGVRAEKEARTQNHMKAFEHEMQKLHAIASPKNLLDPQFTAIFNDAIVLCDFDGVLVHNGKDMTDERGTRRQRALAINSALLRAALAMHEDNLPAAQAYLKAKAQHYLHTCK